LAVNIIGKKQDGSTQWAKIFDASSNQDLNFLVVVSNGQDTTMKSASVRVDVPYDIIYNGNVTLDGNPYSGDIRSGINLGDVSPKAVRTLTFNGRVANNPDKTDTSVMATVTTAAGSASDNVRITLPRGTVAVSDPKVGLAALAGLDFSKPLYILLWIVIAIILLVAVQRILKGFKKE